MFELRGRPVLGSGRGDLLELRCWDVCDCFRLKCLHRMPHRDALNLKWGDGII